jgi:hypothetical protein
MVQATASPLLKATGEAIIIQNFFLGSAIPAGAQTISCTGNGAVGVYAVSYTVTADRDTRVAATATISSDSQANPSATLALGGSTALAVMVYMSGQDDVTGVAPLANWTSSEVDLGTLILGAANYSIVGSTDISAGWIQTADDAVMHAVAIAEVASIAAIMHYRRMMQNN